MPEVLHVCQGQEEDGGRQVRAVQEAAHLACQEAGTLLALCREAAGQGEGVHHGQVHWCEGEDLGPQGEGDSSRIVLVSNKSNTGQYKGESYLEEVQILVPTLSTVLTGQSKIEIKVLVLILKTFLTDFCLEIKFVVEL